MVILMKMVLDKPPKKIWSLNQLKVGDLFVGVPKGEFYENKKGNKFIRLGLDAGYSTCTIYFLVFDFPEQKLLNSKYHNSFELVKFYREVNNILVDENITQLHDINWQEIIDWLNRLKTLKIQVVSTNMNGFKNIKFISYTDESIYGFFGFEDNWRLK